MLHAKVNAIALLRFVNEEIFQRIVAVGWGKRFFAELAVNRTCRMLRLRPHANELISRCALRTKEIDGFGHERLPQSWSPHICRLEDSVNVGSNIQPIWSSLLPGERHLSRQRSGEFSWIICKPRWMR